MRTTIKHTEAQRIKSPTAAESKTSESKTSNKRINNLWLTLWKQTVCVCMCVYICTHIPKIFLCDACSSVYMVGSLQTINAQLTIGMCPGAGYPCLLHKTKLYMHIYFKTLIHALDEIWTWGRLTLVFVCYTN